MQVWFIRIFLIPLLLLLTFLLLFIIVVVAVAVVVTAAFIIIAVAVAVALFSVKTEWKTLFLTWLRWFWRQSADGFKICQFFFSLTGHCLKSEHRSGNRLGHILGMRLYWFYTCLLDCFCFFDTMNKYEKKRCRLNWMFFLNVVKVKSVKN